MVEERFTITYLKYRTCFCAVGPTILIIQMRPPVQERPSPLLKESKASSVHSLATILISKSHFFPFLSEKFAMNPAEMRSIPTTTTSIGSAPPMRPFSYSSTTFRFANALNVAFDLNADGSNLHRLHIGSPSFHWMVFILNQKVSRK